MKKWKNEKMKNKRFIIIAFLHFLILDFFNFIIF